jgi:hypothetical protein
MPGAMIGSVEGSAVEDGISGCVVGVGGMP